MSKKAKLYSFNFQPIEKLKNDFFLKEKSIYKELELDIGIDDNLMKTDRFSIVVFNYKGFQTIYNKYIDVLGFINFNHFILVKDFRETKIINILKKRIESINGADWDEICVKLKIFLSYEFDPNITEWDEFLDND